MMIRLRNTLSIAKIIRSCHQHSNFQHLFLVRSSASKHFHREKLTSNLRLRHSPKLINPLFTNARCCYKTSTRLYSTFNHSKAPTREFLGSFLDHEYAEANSLLFDEEKRNQYLTNLVQLSAELVPRVTIDFYRVVEASFEFPDEGFEFITQFWRALNQLENENLLKLIRRILSQRERLLSLILSTGRFHVYENLVLPSIQKLVPSDELNFLDEVTRILGLQRTPSGLFQYNEESVLTLLMSDNITKSEKRDLVKILVANSLTAGSGHVSRMHSIEIFVKCAKIIEGDGWLTSEISSEYDALFQFIGIPSGEDKFDDYFQEVIKIVENHYNVSIAYKFLTNIMRNLSERAPFVTYRLFEFKSAQWRQRNLLKRDVLNFLDLAYAMKACLKLDENKIYEIYLQNEELHDDESQEAIFLDLCVQHKDWKSLQDRFENMYGKGNLPDTVHYGITMQALEFLEADSELERLYEQILDRGLMMNAAIFIARMKAKIRRRSQKEVEAIFEDYLSLVLQKRADKDGISQIFPFILQLSFLDGDNGSVLATLQAYLEREGKHQLPIVSGKALGLVARHFSQNCALGDLNKLFGIAESFHKFDNGFACSLIDAYSKLGQYAKADDVAYLAHGRTNPPFSDLQIYASQLKNHQQWRRLYISRSIKRYNNIKTNYIVSLALQSEFSIFQSGSGGVDFLSSIMDALRENAIDYSQANSLRYLQGRPIKTINSLLRRQIANRMRLDERLYLPLMKQNLVYQNYKPLNVMKIFNEMNQRRVLVSAKSYIHVMRAMRSLDKKYDRSYKNSTELLKQMLQLYGFDAEKSKSNPRLDFKNDSVLICDILIKYVESVGLKKGSNLFSRFVLFCERAFDGKLPFDLRAKIDCFLSICYKEINSTEYGPFLEQKFEVYLNMISEYIQEIGSCDDASIPPVLNEASSYFTIQRMRYLINENAFGVEQQKEIINVLQMGLQPNIFDYNYIISYFLKQVPLVHFAKTMEIIENHLITGNLSQLKLYREKKLCYKICMIYLCDIYDEQIVAENYKILSDYFGIKSLNKVRAQSKMIGYLNFLKSSSGRLFNIKSDPYGSRSMNQFNFIDYFNPARDLNNEPKLFNETSRLLIQAVSEHCKRKKGNKASFASRYPKISTFCKSDLNYYSKLTAFNGKIDYLNSSQDTRLRRTKDVLRELLFNHNNTKIFIPNTTNAVGKVDRTSS